MSSLKSLRSSKVANYFRRYWHRIHPPSPSSLLTELSHYNIPKPCRILHVGANDGREAEYYHRNGIQAWHVEAIPDVYKLLCATCQRFPTQYPINTCLANKAGCEVSFNIASNHGQSSSLLGLGRHEQAYPSVRYTSSITLQTSTVDELVAKGDLPPDIDFLVIDAQGAELLILQGADRLLKSSTLVGAMIETAVEPLYEGGASYIEVCLLLKEYDLYLCKASFNSAGWCDAIFSKKYWP